METWTLRVTAIHSEALDMKIIFLHRAPVWGTQKQTWD